MARFSAATAASMIAGGASLLDHSAYQNEFRAALVAMDSRAANIVLTGPIADAEMPALYRAASALVFASIKEGFGLCVLEAMACGCAVVGSRVGGTPELIADNERGLLFTSGSTEDLEDKLALLMTNADLRRRLAQAAAEFAKNDLSVEKNVQRASDIYGMLLDRKHVSH